MKNLELGLPVIDGEEVQPEAALAFIDEREVLTVEVEIEGGRKARFAALVNPARIRASDVEKYQNRVTDLALEADDLEQEGEILQAQAESGAQLEVEIGEGESTQLAVPEASALTRETLRVVSASLSLSRRMAEAKADLLVLAIENWNLPFAPSAQFLTERTGLGPAFLAKLEAWFFPTSPPAEADNGTK